MFENWPLATGDVLSQFFLDPLQDFIAPLTADLNLLPPNETTVQIAPGNSGQVAIGIGGLWRHRESATSSPVAGATGTYDVYVVASGRNITGGGTTDSTDYTFGLVLVAHNAAAPSGTYNGNAITQTRKIGEVDWDGSANITGLRQLVGPNTTLPITPTAPLPTMSAVRARAAASQSAPVARWDNSAGAQLAAVNANGTMQATTPAIDDNSTLVATTAYVLGQASGVAPQQVAVAAAAGTSTRWSRADHVHPATAPTPAVSDNSTRIATTAYVLGQASNATPTMDGTAVSGTANTWSRSDHVHPTDTSRAPTANPTLSGTVTLPGTGKATLALTDTTTTTGLTIGTDTNLYRNGAHTLQTDSNLVVGAANAGYAALLSVVAASLGLGVRVSGDTKDRVNIDPNTSRLNFGPGGATSTDTNLYRNGVGLLKTDSELDVGGTFRHLGTQVGFFNVAAVPRPAARSISNAGAALRTIDRNNFTEQNLFDFVATIVSDLQALGFFA